MELVVGGKHEVDDLLTDRHELFLVEVLENVEMVIRKNGKGLGYVMVLQRTLVIVPDGQRTPDSSKESVRDSRVLQVMNGSGDE